MTVHLHTRSICDACRVARATVEIDSGFFLCDSCADIVITSISIPSVSASSEDVNAAAAVKPTPGPIAAVATNSESTLDPTTGVDAVTGLRLSDPAAPVTVNNSVSPDVRLASLPSGESEPSVTLASASGESISRKGDRQAVAAACSSRGAVAAVDPEIEALVSALETAGFPEMPSVIRRGHPDCIIKNDTAFRVAAASLIHASASSSDNSIPST